MTAIPLLIALTQAAAVLHLDAATMINAASDDPHGGYHAAYDDGFPSGSLWRVEGQFLYALVRALKPASVLELGTWHGASATHILQGINDNELGGLTCIDNRAYGDIKIGGMMPKDLADSPFYFIESISIEKFIPHAIKEGWRYDLIFEDAMHTAEQVAFVWSHADRLLNPGGVIVSHDAMHAIAGETVRKGIAQAGYTTTNILISPADCGFALWRKGE
jgi:predicted O-methyltransferase YrrM